MKLIIYSLQAWMWVHPQAPQVVEHMVSHVMDNDDTRAIELGEQKMVGNVI